MSLVARIQSLIASSSYCAYLSCLAILYSKHSDPESEVPFAQALYGNDKFMRAFFNSLSDDGILVMQLGEAPESRSPDETYSKFKNRATTTKLLANLGFESIHAYEEVSLSLSLGVNRHLLGISPFVTLLALIVSLRLLCTVDLRDWIQVLQDTAAVV